ncbi:MAG: hypothetical protein CVU95_03160 [Firmicutes bacterium HGW-Firmicutes-2]|nr:MAG: hypothetical protein CVU95_03160 [Firmicutes bacterium HGW-Firmicutes-2]
MNSDEYYKLKIDALSYEISKYRRAIAESGFDYYDINLDTGEAMQSVVIGKSLGLQPKEYNTIEKISALFHPDDYKKNIREVKRIIEGEIDRFDLQSRVYKKDGSLVWLQYSGTLSYHPSTNDKHLVGLLRDITQEKANIESLKYLADYDGLTHAYNRRSGLLKLEKDVETFESVRIIYIDIDKFKYVNDTYGHFIGDQTLQEFSKKLNKYMPKSTYLIRLGGDEFLCVILNQSEKVIKESTHNLISNPVIFGNQKNDILHFSYGIVSFDQNKHKTVDAFIRDADEQMYIFKKAESCRHILTKRKHELSKI